MAGTEIVGAVVAVGAVVVVRLVAELEGTVLRYHRA